jgi:undecaprenyl-diphosphatase
MIETARLFVNSIDSNIMQFLNHYSQYSQSFDYLVCCLAGNNLFKDGIIALMIWWLWFDNKPQRPDYREQLIATILSACVAMVVARALALGLPFRLRPIYDAHNFLIPYGAESWPFGAWSAFPSDHAVLFFTLSTGLVFVSRKAGLLAIAYTTFFICIPRLYLGLHYPTDVIAGALIGVAFGCIGNLKVVSGKISELILSWESLKPSLFYSSLFLITYQIADTFESSRELVSCVYRFLKAHF